MLNETCPSCSAPLDVSTLAETLRECPKCHSSVVPRDVKAMALLTRSGEEAPRARAQIALSPEFNARYRLLRVVGIGAMGTVVEAADVRNPERRVAVKFQMRLNSKVILDRFVREVRLLSNLSHPGVVRMFDAGELDGHPYVVTEYLSGGTLRDRIKRQRVMPLGEAVTIITGVLSGLGACHAAGLVHRDVKPENVLFGEDGRPRVADLGLAKEEGGEALTADGVALGTPLYMAPEQVQGIAVGPGSDLYSVALMLYELVTGRHPFVAPRLTEILDHHLSTMPKPVHEVAPHLPARLSEVLTAALVKRLEARTQSAAVMAEQLEAVLREAGAARGAAAAAVPAAAPAAAVAGAPSRAPAPAAPAEAPVATPTPALRARSSSRKERPLAPPVERPVATPSGFRALPLWMRAAVALTPFLALAALVLRPAAGPPRVTVSPSATRLQSAFDIPPSSASSRASSVASASASSSASSTAPASSGASSAGLTGGGGGTDGGSAGAAASTEPDDMVRVPGGAFTMGTKAAFATDARAHTVRLRPFWIDRSEVTNARFAKFVEAQSYVTEAERRGHGLVHDGKQLVEKAGADWRHPRGPDDSIEGRDDVPVAQVSWNDAFAFAVWAKRRLPTEAEWERAAGGLARGVYPWGDEAPDGRVSFGRTLADGPMPVGSFAATELGLKDVLGNVREWCGDWYAADYYASSPEENPIGPDSGRARVIRGFGFLSRADELSLTARRSAGPSTAAVDLGFRTVREADR